MGPQKEENRARYKGEGGERAGGGGAFGNKMTPSVPN